MHYYVLFCQSLKIDKLYQIFNNQKNIEAFIPKMEKHIHSKNILVLKPMFPGYLFIKTTYNQIKFDTLLTLMYEQKDGVIRELKKEDVLTGSQNTSGESDPTSGDELLNDIVMDDFNPVE